MRRFLLMCTALTLLACATTPPVHTSDINSKYTMACLPEAVIMSRALQKADIASCVVIFKTDQRQHAICAYMYPPGQNKIWGWDSYYGSCRLKAWWNDSDSISNSWLFHNGGTYEKFLSSETVE